MNDWISCDKRVPADGERILVYVTLDDHEKVQIDEFYEDCGELYLDSGYDWGTDVTYWQHLPKPPMEKQYENRIME